MIRKAVIVVLTFGAVGTAVLFVLSHTVLLYGGDGFSERVNGINECWGEPPVTACVGVIDGFFSSLRYGEPTPDLTREFRTTFGIGTFLRAGPNFLFEISLAVPFAFFAAYPTIAFIRGPLRRWRRRKRGECVNCGYNLTGNVTGTCSECGTKIESP